METTKEPETNNELHDIEDVEEPKITENKNEEEVSSNENVKNNGEEASNNEKNAEKDNKEVAGDNEIESEAKENTASDKKEEKIEEGAANPTFEEPVIAPPIPYGKAQKEEYSDSYSYEEEEEEAPKGNILWRGLKFIGLGIYKAAYYSGEFLADLFGITRPRYEFALNQYYDRERERVMQERMERGEIDENGNEIEQPNTA